MFLLNEYRDNRSFLAQREACGFVIINKERTIMKYRNAAEILPENLLEEIQKYVKGDLLYIPNVLEAKNGEKIVVLVPII
jgi:septum formation topological specificity factor MinE